MKRTHLVFVAKLAISVLILVLVFREVSIGQIAGRIDKLHVGLLIPAAGCLAIQAIIIVTWRWHAVLRILHGAVAWIQLAQMVMVGLFFSQALPTTFGGDGMRIWLLSRTAVPLNVAVRSVVVDRVLGLFGLFLLSLAASISIAFSFETGASIFGLVLVSATGLAFLALIPVLIAWFRHIPWPRFQRLLLFLVQETDSIWRDKLRLGYLLLVTVVGHIGVCLAVWLTARAFAVEVPLAATLVVVPPVVLAAALPISVSGWGVREGGMIFGLGMLDVSTSDAALVSIAVGLMGAALGMLGGPIWLFSEMRRLGASDKSSSGGAFSA